LLQYFLLGILFALIYPIASQLIDTGITWLEVVKIKAQKILADVGVEIEKVQHEAEQQVSFPIGFHVPDPELEEEFDDDI